MGRTKEEWATTLAKMSREEVAAIAQEMVQKLGPMPDHVAEAVRERLAASKIREKDSTPTGDAR